MMPNLRSFSLWLLLALASVARAATPGAGDTAPAFALRTLEGKTVELATLAGETRVVLVVLRGFPGYQCPLCTKQVGEFAARAKDFAAKGARVVMVYPGPADQLQRRAGEFLKDKAWPADFVFLLDPDYTFTNAYELRWEAKNETAYPSTFVIGRDGKVQWAKVSKTHGGRSTAAEVLAKL
ncbi:MAG TPA: peroxiredoxin family protein [Opitutaceae bacterium]